MKIRPKPSSFNHSSFSETALVRTARTAAHHSTARGRYGLKPSVALLLAILAGLHNGGALK
jgi:hypothetical protein